MKLCEILKIKLKFVLTFEKLIDEEEKIVAEYSTFSLISNRLNVNADLDAACSLNFTLRTEKNDNFFLLMCL